MTQRFDDETGLELVPRFKEQGYSAEDVRRRREWLEQRLGIMLPLIGACAIPTLEMRGNIENPVGAAQIPLGIAGPLRVNGMHANDTFYVPLATTEGAPVRSYERGMAMMTGRRRRHPDLCRWQRGRPVVPLRLGGGRVSVCC